MSASTEVSFNDFSLRWEEQINTVKGKGVEILPFVQAVPVAREAITSLQEEIEGNTSVMTKDVTADHCTEEKVGQAREYVRLFGVIQAVFEKVQANKAFYDQNAGSLQAQSDASERAKVLADLGMNKEHVSGILKTRDDNYKQLETQMEQLGQWSTEMNKEVADLATKIDALKEAIAGEGEKNSPLFDLDIEYATFFRAKELITPLLRGRGLTPGNIADATNALAGYAALLSTEEFHLVGTEGA